MVYQAEPNGRLAVHRTHIPQAERSKGPILVFPDPSGFFGYFLSRGSIPSVLSLSKGPCDKGLTPPEG